MKISHILSLILLLTICYNMETLHTCGESEVCNCPYLSDLFDDDNYVQYEELVKCELANSDHCKNNTEGF